MPLKIVAAGWIVIAIVAYALGMSLRADAADHTGPAEPAGPGYTEALPSHGPLDAAVVIVEVVDYNCRFCSIRAGLMKRLAIEHGRDVLFVRKHFPFLKPNSASAAAATMAAGRQGAFTAFEDQLFLHQGAAWKEESYVAYATKIGLDVEQFQKDLKDPQLAAHVTLDKAAAEAVGVRATPTIFVNGKLTPPNANADTFRQMIQRSRQRVSALLKSGKYKTVAEARNAVAAQNHASGELFSRYYMQHDVRSLAGVSGG